MNDSSKKQQEEQAKDGEGVKHANKADTVPDQRLTHARKAMSWLEAAGYQARLAGGCVRDRILGIRPKDYDIATDAKPDEVSLIFKQKSIKVIPTGIDHGTVTVVMGGQGLEITTLRKDVRTDGRHAEVVFGRSFEEDAERRDFSMNALYEDLNGQVYDYFDGRGDIQRGELRFVGRAEARIREDYLRILRLFRFWARFGFRPDAATLAAVKKEVQGLARISQERCTSEILEIFAEEEILEVLKAMQSTGTLEQIFQLSITPPLEEIAAYKSIRKTERAACRLAALLRLSWSGAPLAEYLTTLRLSKAHIQRISSLIHPPKELKDPEREDPASLMEVLDQLEPIWGHEALLLATLPAFAELYPDQRDFWERLLRCEREEGSLRRSPLPLRGQQVMQELSIEAGPELGLLMQELRRSYRRGQWKTPAEGIGFLKRLRAKGVLSQKSSS